MILLCSALARAEPTVAGHGAADVVVGVYENRLPGFAIGELLAGAQGEVAAGTAFRAGLELHEVSEEWDIELDELYLDRTLHPALRLTLGKLYTPLTWWSAHTERGSLRYVPMRAPVLLTPEWRGGPLPVHQIGLSAAGSIPLGRWALGYGAMIGNGRSPVIGATADSGDTDFSKALLGRVWLTGPGGLTVGAAAYHDRVLPAGEARGWGDLLDGSALARRPLHLEDLPGAASITNTIDEDILSAHLVWSADRLHLLAEGIWIRHIEADLIEQTSQSGYLQLSWSARRGSPYVRLEHLEMRYGDPLYSYIQTLLSDQAAAGMRWDLAEHLAATAQLSYLRETHYSTYGVALPERHLDAELQLAVGF